MMCARNRKLYITFASVHSVANSFKNKKVIEGNLRKGNTTEENVAHFII